MDKKKWRLTKFKKEKHENLIVFKKITFFPSPCTKVSVAKLTVFFPHSRNIPQKTLNPSQLLHLLNLVFDPLVFHHKEERKKALCNLNMFNVGTENKKKC
jgi:hypothetical protein